VESGRLARDHGTCVGTRQKLLRDYEEPKLDEAKNEELLDYIARREREIPEDQGLNEAY
jgi:trimethylamine--corrinoid protein Co-methyltransferase